MIGKHWCFTLNHPLENEVIPRDLITYLVIGNEVGEEKTPHQQGFVSFKVNKRLAAVKKILPRAHWEIKSKRSTFVQATDYCKKDGDFIEEGVHPLERGHAGGGATKRKFDEAWELAKVGDFENIDKSILVPYYNAVKRIRQDYSKKKPSLPACCGEWFIGQPGTGKSHTAREEHPDCYDKACNKWWDGYVDEEVVLLDDFDLHHKGLGHHLKRWGDKYSFPAEMKGTTIQIRPKKIIVTSNHEIEDIFHETPVLVKALKRRFVVRRFDQFYE